jgi:hypothetical protein
VFYSLLVNSAGDVYASRCDEGATLDSAVLTVDPVPADLGNPQPADFTSHPFATLPDPARRATLAEVFQYFPGWGIRPAVDLTRAQLDALFPPETDAPGIPGWRVVDDTTRMP